MGFVSLDIETKLISNAVELVGEDVLGLKPQVSVAQAHRVQCDSRGCVRGGSCCGSCVSCKGTGLGALVGYRTHSFVCPHAIAGSIAIEEQDYDSQLAPGLIRHLHDLAPTRTHEPVS